ncbi:glycerophosphodiester phosphodiesterase [Bremerella sp.]|uniref:glycerophosphodiester phosphodiesterase n=1 Tax=Bremerella sp. TaxID=2795602 RepID=UPI003918A5E9
MNLRWTSTGLSLALLLAVAGYVFAQGPIILAHRGGAYEFEENTMEAFRACYERGIRGFETDVRMTKDGVLVILHDDSLDRTHNATGPVEQKTADELQDVVTKKGQKMLFLDELLDYFADKPGVYIELEMKISNKKLYPDSVIDDYCKKLYSAAEARKHEDSTYVYSSFDERPLKAIHALDAKAPMSLIASKPCSAEFIERAKQLGADRIACQLKGTSREDIEQAHKSGLGVNCWPGRAAEDYLLTRGLGADVHCTDIPTVIQGVKEKLE